MLLYKLLGQISKVALVGLFFSTAFTQHLRAGAQTAPSSASIMVEIQCKPGTADQWRQAFTKELLPSIRESIQNADTFTGFSYFEAPLPYQDYDFILVFEMKSFASLDVPRPFPHYQALFRRLGPERGEALLKEMGGWEQRVDVRVLRSYKVAPSPPLVIP